MKDIPLHPRQVVCPDGRKRYARLLRELCRGAITNDEYERRFEELDCADTAIRSIHAGVKWDLCSDFEEHRLKGKHRLSRQSKREVAKAVLFLRTDKPGDAWEPAPGLLTALRACVPLFAILGLMSIFIGAWVYAPMLGAVMTAIYLGWTFLDTLVKPSRESAPLPPLTPWPFLSQHDLDEARAHPNLLAG